MADQVFRLGKSIDGTSVTTDQLNRGQAINFVQCAKHMIDHLSREFDIPQPTFHLVTVAWQEHRTLDWSWENIAIKEPVADWVLEMSQIEGRRTILHSALEITEAQYDAWTAKYG